jgi:large subunit ribosomal protein L1
MELKQALEELRKEEKRKFAQGVDLIVNLKGVDMKRDNIATVITLPNKFKDKKVCGFLNNPSKLVKTVTKLDFPKYKEKKDLKKLIKEYDAFIASAQLMPAVATTFGKVLGPAGKMPSPQLGVVMQETDSAITELVTKISKSIRVKAKEPSIKIVVAKDDMSDDKIIENVKASYFGIVEALPTKRENVKNVMIKLTMSKPIKVEIK